jgi:small-conductance mechanosensitive channel
MQSIINAEGGPTNLTGIRWLPTICKTPNDTSTSTGAPEFPHKLDGLCRRDRLGAGVALPGASSAAPLGFGEFTDQDPVQHELRKRILRRFKEEGIEIPFPQRTVHLETSSQP